MCENKECLTKSIELWSEMYRKKDEECTELLQTIGKLSVKIAELEAEVSLLNKAIEDLEKQLKEIED